MAKNKNSTEITALITYFENVIAWIKQLFPTYREKMQKGLEWGLFYNKYKNNIYDTGKLENEIKTLIADDEVTKKSGIYEYLLSGKNKHKESCLSLRSFTENQKLKKYEQQNGICVKCGEKFELSAMQGDHIIAWSDGGKTTDDNLQMLCKKCNATKSNK